jgi:site-specific recombinase XerD
MGSIMDDDMEFEEARTALVPVAPDGSSPAVPGHALSDLPALVAHAGPAGAFVWDEFFAGEIRNPHTRTAYERAVRGFLGWCSAAGIDDLRRVAPGDVGRYQDQLTGGTPKKKLHLAAIRRYFDRLVTRHIVMLNPAASVRGERYAVVEGKTPEISVEQARLLLRSMDASTVVGLRDRAVIGILIYTAARAGAVAKLRIRSLQHDGSQWRLRFEEKGGKSREIPVRHDLQGFILEYVETAGLRDGAKDEPLFRTTVRKTKQLTDRGMTGIDICRMVKRRLRDAGLPSRLSPHSFRVATVTDLLDQGAPLDEVQHLAGHADPRTTRLYDRRKKQVTRNLVERISI